MTDKELATHYFGTLEVLTDTYIELKKRGFKVHIGGRSSGEICDSSGRSPTNIQRTKVERYDA